MTSFENFTLNNNLLKAIGDLGFEMPTPIQEKTIPYILESKDDLVALAQTGTGKTAGFGLPILQKIQFNSLGVQALVLCPTRELCMQISRDMESYSKYEKRFNIVAVYGGINIQPQIKAIRQGVHMIIGTPGRTLDLIRRKVLKINELKWLVLDEADEMLTMGFKDDLDAILSETPSEKQTLLFSATMPAGIRDIAKNYMHNPSEISVGQRNAGAENVEHEYFVVHSRDRYDALKRVVDMHPNIYGIVFCRTRMETKEVADKLMADGYNADALHGDLSQAQRDFVMNRFRQRHLQLLIATDVAARGLDVDDLTHVINYNLPDELEVYVHRTGRTGRAGKKGLALSIIHTREPSKIKQLEKIVKKQFVRKEVPGGIEICEKQLFNLIDKVENVPVNDQEIEQFLPQIYKKLSWLDREELIKRFVSVEFNRFLAYYQNARDINVSAKETQSGSRRYETERGSKNGRNRRERRTNRDDRKFDGAARSSDAGERRSGGGDRRSGGGQTSFVRCYVNLGTKHNLNPSKLIGLINERTNSNKIEVGKIEMMKNFSFFEIDEQYQDKVISALSGLQWGSVKVMVELKTSQGPKKQRRKEKNKGQTRK